MNGSLGSRLVVPSVFANRDTPKLYSTQLAAPQDAAASRQDFAPVGEGPLLTAPKGAPPKSVQSPPRAAASRAGAAPGLASCGESPFDRRPKWTSPDGSQVLARR